MHLDKSQSAFCETNSNFIRLLAPAGSGKTLSLLWRCRRLFEKNEDKNIRILIFTFTKVARDELKERLINDDSFSMIRKIVRIDTLNSWGFNYLKRNVGSNLELKASKKDSFFIIKNLLRPVWINNPVINDSLKKNQWKFSAVMEIFNSMKSSGFRHDSSNLYSHFLEHVEWLNNNGCGRYFESTIYKPLQELELLDNKSENITTKFKPFLDFWKDGCNLLWDSAVITLDDQKYWAWLKLNERYGDSVFPEPNRYQHILVDEFQDINPLDLFLINTLQKVNNSSLVIVGDDDQAIYEWRGSSPNFIVDPEKFFRKSFESHKLNINYRSPKNIVERSQKFIKNNTNRVPKIVHPNLDYNAEIVLKSFPTHMDSIQYILELTYEAKKKNLPREIAIISRKKSQIIPLQIILASEDIPFYAKEDLNILLSYTFEDLKEILLAVATKYDRKYPKDIVNSFLTVCNKVKTFPLKRAESQQLFKYLIQKRPRTFSDALNYFLEYDGILKGSQDQTMKLEYFQAIKSIIDCEAVSDAIDEISWQLKGLQKHYAKSEDDIFYKDPPFLYLAEYAKKYKKDFYGFIEHVEKSIDIMTSNSYSNTDNYDSDYFAPIHLMTALRAKGKEFETVVLLDVNDGIWPSKLAETDMELEQERRVFYVAVTRAKKKLIISTVDSIVDKVVFQSPYIEELGLSMK